MGSKPGEPAGRVPSGAWTHDFAAAQRPGQDAERHSLSRSPSSKPGRRCRRWSPLPASISFTGKSGTWTGGITLSVGVLIDHRFLGVRVTRKGRVFGWREGSGYGFSDLSCRDKRRGFPHVYIFRLRREGNDRCSLRIEIKGRWTAGWIPRSLVALWLQLIFTKIAVSASRIILTDAVRTVSGQSTPHRVSCEM